MLALFAVLVLALLWFQGLIFRQEPAPAELPGAPGVTKGTRTARVERRVLPRVRVHPGFVEAIDPASLAPRVMASVVSVAAREGDRVEAGAELVVLDDRDARARLEQARAELRAASAQTVQAELALDRAQRLHDEDASTAAALEAAQAARDAARAREESGRRAVEEGETALSWFRLSAPFGGRVLERHADPGDLATPGHAVLVLYREDRLRLRVAVPEERAPGLRAGETLEVEFDGLPAREAALARVLPPADPATGTVVLHLDLAPSEDLRPGLLGRLRLATGEREALLLPLEAVERIGQVERVLLVRSGTYAPAVVRTGKRHGELVEVQSGLAEGDEVVLP